MRGTTRHAANGSARALGGIRVLGANRSAFRVTANQGFSAAPSYLYSLTPDFGAISPGTAAGGGDFPLGDGLVHVYDTTALASFAITRRGSVEAVSSYRYSALDTSSTSNETDLRSYSVGGRFRYGLTRNGSLRLGYVYRQGRRPDRCGRGNRSGRPTVVHDIDVGLDYRRALSLTRRTSIGFSTGSTIVTVPVEGSTNGQLQYRVVGDVGLQHEIGRTWLARLAYNRGVGFAEAFNQPVFADGVNLSVSGFLAAGSISEPTLVSLSAMSVLERCRARQPRRARLSRRGTSAPGCDTPSVPCGLCMVNTFITHKIRHRAGRCPAGCRQS